MHDAIITRHYMQHFRQLACITNELRSASQCDPCCFALSSEPHDIRPFSACWYVPISCHQKLYVWRSILRSTVCALHAHELFWSLQVWHLQNGPSCCWRRTACGLYQDSASHPTRCFNDRSECPYSLLTITACLLAAAHVPWQGPLPQPSSWAPWYVI